MTYEEALNAITKKQSLGIMPGLSRISTLLEIMGNPQKKLKIIHIAGTNGKGTVSALIAKALTNSGYKAGLFTSPWVDDYTEQIQINSSYIPKDIFANYVNEYAKYDATEFELVTAIMYKYFCDSGVDYAVVECGMGGQGDSTNAIDTPEIAVITSVSLDHTNFFGNSIENIAREKAGIIKKNGTVVLYPNKKTQPVFEEKCTQMNARLIKLDDTGDYMQNNILTAQTALNELKINSSLSPVSLPARQEYIKENILIDGAHNPEGANALVKNLPDREITAVIGMMRDKEVDAYLSIVAPYCKRIIATTPSNSRAMDCNELKALAQKYCDDVISISNPLQAIRQSDYDLLLVCGSFYLARDVRKELL
ncbi:MAG: bifunctional folylpolyglutamate synthase/dihydrofolate synthase [Eubacterium sp.]